MLGVLLSGQACARTFYVNDDTTAGDVYTTAIGQDCADCGTNAAKPMLTFTNLLAVYDLEPGDQVLVDTGTYSNYNWTVGSDDIGSAAAKVVFQGSTNTAAGGTVIRRGSYGGTAAGLDPASGASNLVFRDFFVREAYAGVRVAPQCRDCLFERIRSFDNTHGIWFQNATYDMSMNNCIFAENSSYGVFANGVTQRAFFENGVFWSNGVAVSFLGSPCLTISNSVIAGGETFLLSRPAGDYNVFWNCTLPGPNLYTWQKETNAWWHSTVADPLFANPATLDFHPLSSAGRFDPSTTNYVYTDSVISPLIDMGDPTSVFTNEPSPNGGRRNAGPWGNSHEASKSPTQAILRALSFNDGGEICGACPLYWAYNTNFVSGVAGTAVRVDYSPDWGAHWFTVSNNVALTTGNAGFTWDASAITSTPAALWRVTSEADGVSDTNDAIFVIRGVGTIDYFVSTTNTDHNVYCTAPGSATNNGLSADAPKLTIEDILSVYDLGAGDTIYVDTGVYPVTNSIVFTAQHQGSTNGWVTVQGSTNEAAGGTVLQRINSAAHVVSITNADFVSLRDLTVDKGSYGVNIGGSRMARLTNVKAMRNTRGFNVDPGNFQAMAHFDRCIAFSNSLNGVQCAAVSNMWDRGVCWGNGSYAFVSTYTNSISVSNSIIVGGTAFGSQVPAVGDYNVFWDTDLPALIGATNLNGLQKSRNDFWHSTYLDPGLADPGGMDFHAMSLVGRWDWGVTNWVTDTVHAVSIDMGDPAAAYAEEPEPNGARMNASPYGNTWQASMSRTQAWLQALTYNDGGILLGGNLNASTDTVYWAAGGMTNGTTVRIELSGDDGATWVVAASNILASLGAYTWASTNYDSSTASARWRVVYESQTNVVSANAARIEFVNGPYKYYVNDASTNGDVYCTAPGNDGNSGTTPGSPKASLTNLLASYYMQGGEAIRIDTGTYGPQAFGAANRQDNETFVYLLGSSNRVAGGTVIAGSTKRTNALTVTGANALYISDIEFRGNTHGVVLSGTTNTLLNRVVIRDAFSNGLVVADGSVAWVRDSVLYNNTNAGVRVDAGVVYVSNSIVAAYSPEAFCYHAVSNDVIRGDYNALHAASNAVLGYLADMGRRQDALSAWTAETGSERHSLEADPLFANPASGDFHLKTATVNGRYVRPGVYTNDAVTSDLIDAGDPALPFALEPANNGNRINIGLYGNTPQASRGRTAAWLAIGQPALGGYLKGTGLLHWVAGQAATGHAVRVEYSPDGGATWSVLTDAVPASVESLSWTTTETNDTPAGLWRVTSTNAPSVAAQASNFFAVRNAPLNLYLNDADTNGDVYCAAPGASNNWRATADAPLSDPAAALAVYDLEPGDVLFMDTGVYTTQTDAVWGRRDSGVTNSPVSLAGSTNELFGGSVIDRGDRTAGTRAVSLIHAEFVSVSNLQARNAGVGLELNRSRRAGFEGLRIMSNLSHGVVATQSVHVSFERSVSAFNDGLGLSAQLSSNIQWSQSIVWSNAAGAVEVKQGTAWIRNSVMEASGDGTFVYDVSSALSVTSDHNNVIILEEAAAARVAGQTFETLFQWQSHADQDLRSLSHDPRFADPSGGDFRLMSAAGRVVPGWANRTNDAVTSPMIDTGATNWPYANEPQPNGRRVNMGLYGNSTNASLSLTNGWFVALTLNSGGSVRGTNSIYWIAGGAATGTAVSLQYSTDGVTWSNIVTNLSVGITEYAWDTSPLDTRPEVFWRVISETDSNVWDATDSSFVVNNGAVTYYVNDDSLDGDVYTFAVGNSTNDGVSPYTPKASIKDVLDTFTLRSIDRVKIDTGYYPLDEEIVFSDLHGSVTNPCRITGSTNLTAGGTVFDFMFNSNGVIVSASDSVWMEYVRILNASEAVRVSASTNTVLQWIWAEDGLTGFRAVRATNTAWRHCVARDNQNYGLRFDTGSGSGEWNFGVIWSNRYGVYADMVTNDGPLTVRHSILGALKDTHYVYSYRSLGPDIRIFSDYNNIVLRSGARAGYLEWINSSNVEYQSVSRWTRRTGQDGHTLTVEPGFVNLASNDYHLVSEVGHYDTATGGFVLGDTNTSALIDAGDPAAAYTNEVDPNGSRVNIGLYGNTPEASKSSDAQRFTVLTYNDGGFARGVTSLYWVAYGVATGYNIKVDYSADDGFSWQPIVTNWPAALGGVQWTGSLYQASPVGVWRVSTTNEIGGTSDTNDVVFALRNTNLNFYANDADTNGDVYCSAAGQSNFYGWSADKPSLSIQRLFDRYDMEPGDRVWVDTGRYAPTGTVVIGAFDGGATTDRMRMTGSTNVTAGGTVLADQGVLLLDTRGVALRSLIVTNALTGFEIEASLGCAMLDIEARDGEVGYGLVNASSNLMERCVASGNASYGIQYASGSGTEWRNGVLWSNQYAVSVSGGSLLLRNSLIGVWGAGRYAFYLSYVGGSLTSDYNQIVLGNQGFAGYLSQPPPADALIYPTVSDWVNRSGRDTHSLSGDARLSGGVEPFRPLSQAGRYDVTVTNWLTNTVTSPMIDAGDPSTAWTNEPLPNGDRINIGRYGGSDTASKSPTNARLTVLSLNDGGFAEGVMTLRWLAAGDATGQTVNLEYSYDGGSTWANVASGVAAAQGYYAWTSTAYQSSSVGRWRITCVPDGSVVATNERVFALRNQPLAFYVNDGSTHGDVYCSAVGSPLNDGAFPSSPKASIQALLDAYDLEAGDTVYVDTGVYAPTGTITLTRYDKGYGTNLVTIQGSTNSLARGTILRDYGFALNNADSMALRYLTLSNATTAVYMHQSDNTRCEWMRVKGGSLGFQISDSDNVSLMHNLVEGSSGAALQHGNGSTNTLWQNGVMWSNRYGVQMASGVADGLLFKNSVIAAFQSGDYAYYLSTGNLEADYNDIYLENGAFAGYRINLPLPDIYQTVNEWVSATGQDIRSLTHDPKFYDVPNGDYHLMSQQGRYEAASNGYVQTDTKTSVLIDAGDPESDYALETEPNGERINMGLYGNSTESSKTVVDPFLTCITANDGGILRGVTNLFWSALGGAITQQVRLDFSWDAGETWTNIAPSIAASNEVYLWDSLTYSSTVRGVWRIISLDQTNIADETDRLFALRNEPIEFFVNDNVTEGDVYCLTVGASTNTGVDASSPLSTIQAVFDAWDLEGGDTVYVDTGNYTLTSPIQIGRFDAGVGTNRVVVQGSTNEAAGGSVLTRYAGGYAFYIYQAEGIGLRNLTIRNAGSAVRTFQSDDFMAEWVWCRDGNYGFDFYYSSDPMLRHCALVENQVAGVLLEASTGLRVENSLVWSNSYGIELVSGSLDLEHSLFGVFGDGAFAYRINSGTVTSDYNCFSLENEGGVAVLLDEAIGSGSNVLGSVAQWSQNLAQDMHSLSVDPRVADTEGGDFHPLSLAGRFDVYSGWTTDGVSSLIIDAGNPLSDCSNETDPNGGRVNIGLYGNSAQASRSATNSVLQTASLNNGGVVSGMVWLTWAAYGNATGQQVTISVSLDNGATWSNLVTGLAAGTQAWDWNTTGFVNSAYGRWRILSEDESGVGSTTAVAFVLGNGGMAYFVNDGSTAGDVYCTAIGAATNRGDRADSPRASLQSVLDDFDLQPGDAIYIDTGEYKLASEIVLGDRDAGTADRPVVLQGSTNRAAGGSVFDRQDPGEGTMALHLYETAGIRVRHLTLQNAGAGMKLTRSLGCVVESTRSEDNGQSGFSVDDCSPVFRRCLAWKNGEQGLLISLGSAYWLNSVIWPDAASHAIRFAQPGAAFVSNSVLRAWGEDYRIYDLGQAGSIYGDYNNLLRVEGAYVAEKDNPVGGNDFYESAANWADGTGVDRHSLSHDPEFADLIGGDFHVMSANGRWVDGSGWVTNNEAFSPMLDTAVRGLSYTNETEPNGLRPNMGLYGGTPEASHSRTNPWVLAIALNDGGTAGKTNTLIWTSGNVASTDLVVLAYSLNNGVEWSAIATNAVSVESYTWEVAGDPFTVAARWRLSVLSDSGIIDSNDVAFAIRTEPVDYFVNDTSMVNDVYCSAPGSATNSGRSAGAPLDSVLSIFDKYPLGPGDEIYVDTGFYALTNAVIFNELSRGRSGFPIRVIGSTNRLTGGSIFSRGSTNEDDTVVILRDTRYIQLEHLTLQDGGKGLQINNSSKTALTDVRICSNVAEGVSIGLSDLEARRCALWANHGVGLAIANAAAVQWLQGVVWSNRDGAATISSGSLILSNSVVHAVKCDSTTNRTYLFDFNQGSMSGDGNVYWVEQGAQMAHDAFRDTLYETLQSLQQAYACDTFSALLDPGFVDAAAGDFSLLSAQGRRLVDGTWTNDAESSWAIDAGVFGDAYDEEFDPNGQRINVGLHGNSGWASMSPTSRALRAVSFDDGGTVNGAVTLYWLARGYTNTDTVRIDVSTDGLVWSNVAQGVSVAAEGYAWTNPGNYGFSVSNRWRVLAEDGSAGDTNDTPFFLRVGAAFFYANDASTVDDVYCDAPGSAGNIGTSPQSPKASLRGILETYDVNPGDFIFVDTGYYPDTNRTFLSAADSGSSSGTVMIAGSWKGSVLDLSTTGALASVGLYVSDASHVVMSNFTIVGASVGLSLLRASDCLFENILVCDSGPTLVDNSASGIQLSQATSNRFSRCVVTRIRGNGVASSTGSGNDFNRCVIWSNTRSAVLVSAGQLGVSNSVLHAYGLTNRCYNLGIGGSVVADYNNLLPVGGAECGSRVRPSDLSVDTLEGVPQWVATFTQDVHSLSVDPLFADPANDDFHPRSRHGRYDPLLGWVYSDTQTTWMIDNGNPAFDWAHEEAPNGSNINIGVYGNTTEASKSRTNAWMLAVTANGGGTVAGQLYLVWSYGNVEPTNTVSLQYSYDDGVNWTNIVMDREYEVWERQYLWDSSVLVSNGLFRYPSSPQARWRVYVDADTNINDQTDTYFTLRNEPIYYYLNDAFTNNDVFTTAPGSDGNLGFYPYSPMLTFNALLQSNSIEGGDVILADTGVYTNEALLTTTDEGLAEKVVTIQGPTNGPGAIWYLADMRIAGSHVRVNNLFFDQADLEAIRDDVVVRNISVSNGSLTVRGIASAGYDADVHQGEVVAGGTNLTLGGITIREGGLYLSGLDVLVENLLAYGGTGAAVTVNSGKSMTLRNATLAGPKSQFVQKGDNPVSTVENTIFVADGKNNFCIERISGTVESDYNNFVIRNGAWIGSYNGYWEKLIYWQEESGQDLHSIGVDPLFVDEAGRDYHLKSIDGHWTATGYVADAETSPCIDSGSPLTTWTNEPDPNGARVNMGAYGNTTQASKSAYDAWLLAIALADGGAVRSNVTLRWAGGGFAGNDTITLSVSTNGGGIWSDIVVGYDADAFEYLWDSSAITNSLYTFWRVSLDSDTNRYSINETAFSVRNAPLSFYVNDGWTNGDIYCTAPGTNTNDGLTPGTPLDTIGHVLDRYDTEGFDTIYVDTGAYALTNNTTIYWSRGGDPVIGSLLILGSTNWADGGTVLSRGSTNSSAYAFDVKGSYVRFREMDIRGANYGVFLDGMVSGRVERCALVSNFVGVAAVTSDYVYVLNSRFWANQDGVRINGAEVARMRNNTYHGNDRLGVYVEGSLGVSVRNSIFSMTNDAAAALGGNIQQPNVEVDYNVYAFGGTEATIFYTNRDLRGWQLNYQHDYRSAITNPLFASPETGDFHLKSAAGRWLDGYGWTNDALTSWAIDKGDPDDDYSAEPQTNGNRVNVGAYGNTEQASKGVTNPIVFCRSLNEVTFISDTNGTQPLIWHVLNVPTNLMVNVQYSGNGGLSWTNLQTVSAYQEYYIWELSPFFNSFKGRWRVVGVGDTNYWDINNDNVDVFFGEFAIRELYTANTNLANIVWRGAWDEWYRVEYSTNMIDWFTAPSGDTRSYQTNDFLSTSGGDIRYEDRESSVPPWRHYRVQRVVIP